VNTVCDDSRISKQNRKVGRSSRIENTIIGDKSSILDLTDKHNPFDITLRDVSKITKKEDFVLNNEFHNSLFKGDEEDYRLEEPDMGFKNNEFDDVLHTSLGNEKHLTEGFLKVNIIH
jgi:hypothetical protein